MVLVFKPGLFSRLGSTAIEFTYFKGGPIGKFLHENNKALLFVEQTEAHPTEGIYGVANIREIRVGEPRQLWALYEHRNPVFTPDEYRRFSANKSSIISIVMDQFEKIDPLPVASFIEDVIKDEVDIGDIGHLYIDDGVLTRFRAIRPPKTGKGVVGRYRVALSFAGEDRDPAEALPRC